MSLVARKSTSKFAGRLTMQRQSVPCRIVISLAARPSTVQVPLPISLRPIPRLANLLQNPDTVGRGTHLAGECRVRRAKAKLVQAHRAATAMESCTMIPMFCGNPRHRSQKQHERRNFPRRNPSRPGQCQRSLVTGLTHGSEASPTIRSRPGVRARRRPSRPTRGANETRLNQASTTVKILVARTGRK